MVSGQNAAATVDQFGRGFLRVRSDSASTLIFDGERLGSRAIYLRDNDSGDFWRIGYGADRRCRHGFGYTVIEETIDSLKLTWTITVSPESAVEIWLLDLKNSSDRKRRLSVFWVANWATDRSEPIYSGQTIAYGVAVTERRTTDPAATYFLSLDKEPSSYDTDRRAFFGSVDNWERPAAVVSGKSSRSLVSGANAIGVLEKNVTLGTKAELQYAAFIGAVTGDSPTKLINALTGPYKQPGGLERLVEATAETWQTQLRHNQVKIPVENVSHYVNGLLSYQSLSRRYWGEADLATAGIMPSSQAAAAYSALAYDPTHAVTQIEAALVQVCKDGRLAAWWDGRQSTLTNLNIADNEAVITLAVAIVKETGDKNWLTKHLPYYDGGSGSILEHILRLTNAAYEQIRDNFGSSGSGRTDQACRLVAAMKEVGALHIHLNDHHLEDKIQSQIKQLTEMLNHRFWIGPWYSRGSLDGQKLSTKTGAASFDLSTQVAAMVGGVASLERANQILKAIKRHWPNLPPTIDPAYREPVLGEPTSAYALGERDNGGITVAQLAELATAWTAVGNGDAAWQLVEAVLPTTNQKTTVTGHLVGSYLRVRGREIVSEDFVHDFGSAEVITRVIRERIFGLQPVIGGLKIDPCLPKNWRSAEISRRFRGADYHIRIHNPFQNGRGVDRIVVDGIRLTGNVVRPFTTGAHFVEVTLA